MHPISLTTGDHTGSVDEHPFVTVEHVDGRLVEESSVAGSLGVIADSHQDTGLVCRPDGRVANGANPADGRAVVGGDPSRPCMQLLTLQIVLDAASTHPLRVVAGDDTPQPFRQFSRSRISVRSVDRLEQDPEVAITDSAPTSAKLLGRRHGLTHTGSFVPSACRLNSGHAKERSVTRPEVFQGAKDPTVFWLLEVATR